MKRPAASIAFAVLAVALCAAGCGRFAETPPSEPAGETQTAHPESEAETADGDAPAARLADVRPPLPVAPAPFERTGEARQPVKMAVSVRANAPRNPH